MVDPQLFEYVRQQVGLGVRNEEIAKTLLEQGYSVSMINEAIGQAGGLEPDSAVINAPVATVDTGTPSGTGLLKPLLILLAIVSLVSGVLFYRLYQQPVLRDQIMQIWRSDDAMVAEIKPARDRVIKYCSSMTLATMNLPPCLNRETNKSYFMEYVALMRTLFDAELEHSTQMKKLADQNWWLIDDRTKKQVEGYYDLQHSAPAAKTREALASMDVPLLLEANKEFDEYYTSHGYDKLLQKTLY